MVREEGNALLLLSQTSHLGEVVLNRFPEVVNDWILSTAGAWSVITVGGALGDSGGDGGGELL